MMSSKHCLLVCLTLLFVAYSPTTTGTSILTDPYGENKFPEAEVTGPIIATAGYENDLQVFQKEVTFSNPQTPITIQCHMLHTFAKHPLFLVSNGITKECSSTAESSYFGTNYIMFNCFRFSNLSVESADTFRCVSIDKTRLSTVSTVSVSIKIPSVNISVIQTAANLNTRCYSCIIRSVQSATISHRVWLASNLSESLTKLRANQDGTTCMVRGQWNISKIICQIEVQMSYLKYHSTGELIAFHKNVSSEIDLPEWPFSSTAAPRQITELVLIIDPEKIAVWTRSGYAGIGSACVLGLILVIVVVVWIVHRRRLQKKHNTERKRNPKKMTKRDTTKQAVDAVKRESIENVTEPRNMTTVQYITKDLGVV